MVVKRFYAFNSAFRSEISVAVDDVYAVINATIAAASEADELPPAVIAACEVGPMNVLSAVSIMDRWVLRDFVALAILIRPPVFVLTISRSLSTALIVILGAVTDCKGIAFIVF